MFKEKKEIRPENRKSIIKLGFNYLSKNEISIAKAYFEQAGLANEDIESWLDSPEIKEFSKEDLTEREKKEKIKEFYTFLLDFKGKFEQDVQEAAREVLDIPEKEK